LDTAAAINAVEGTPLLQVQWLIGLDIDTNAAVQQSSQPTTQSVTYASAAAVSRKNGGSGPPSKLRHAVSAVVYADRRANERRAKTVVVSGLAPS